MEAVKNYPFPKMDLRKQLKKYLPKMYLGDGSIKRSVSVKRHEAQYT